jgi:hypothetical protein
MVLLSTGELLLLLVYYFGSSVADQDLVESGMFKNYLYVLTFDK